MGRAALSFYLPGQSLRGFDSHQPKHSLRTTQCRVGYNGCYIIVSGKLAWCLLMYTPRRQMICGFSSAFSHPCVIWAHILSYLVGILTAGWILCWTNLLQALACWANLLQLFSPFYLIMVSLIYGTIFIQMRENTPRSHMSTKLSPGLTVFLLIINWSCLSARVTIRAQWSQTTPPLRYMWPSRALLELKDIDISIQV